MNKKEEFIVGISTSFISEKILGGLNGHQYNHIYKLWEKSKYEFIENLCFLLKAKYNAVVVMGGWMITDQSSKTIYHWNKFWPNVDYFIIGDGLSVLYNLSKNEKINHNYKFVVSDKILDFSDQSSSPLPEDYINFNESLSTELAAGCIFSCSFCDFGSLGKKKHEFMRSYESLKKEIEYNYKTFGTTVYSFTDNIINDNNVNIYRLVGLKLDNEIKYLFSKTDIENLNKLLNTNYKISEPIKRHFLLSDYNLKIKIFHTLMSYKTLLFN